MVEPFVTRDPGVARRLGWSQGVVAEVRRLAAEAARAAESGYAPSSNPWLSRSSHIPVRTGSYADALLGAAQHLSRSQQVWNGTDATAKAVAQLVADLAGMGVAGNPAMLLQELLKNLGGISPQQFMFEDQNPLGSFPFTQRGSTSCDAGGGAGFVKSGVAVPGVCGAVWPAVAGAPPNLPAVFGPGFPAASIRYVSPHPFNPAFELWTTVARWSSAPNPIPQVQRTGVMVLPMPQVAPQAKQLAAVAGALGIAPLGNPLPQAQQQAVNQVREALDLRLAVQPYGMGLPKTRPGTKGEAGPWSNVLPAISVETDGQQWVKSPPHVYMPDRGGAKSAKLKLHGPIVAAHHIVMGALTESNDFINNLWSTLPRSKKRAGLTKTGNRRTDSMLRDLYNAWDDVDFSRALGNFVENEVEDFLIGREARAWNSQSRSSGQGLGTHMMRDRPGDHWGKPLATALGDAVAGTAYSHGFGMRAAAVSRRGVRAIRDANWNIRNWRYRNGL